MVGAFLFRENSQFRIIRLYSKEISKRLLTKLKEDLGRQAPRQISETLMYKAIVDILIKRAIFIATVDRHNVEINSN